MSLRNKLGLGSELGEQIDDLLDSATPFQLVVGVVIMFAFFLALPQFLNNYYVQVLFTVFLFITLAFGWNTLSGFTGYVNFGYAGFVGLGSYITVLSIVDLGLPWYAALLLAGFLTGVFGTIISAPVLRLRGAYFAIAMLSLAVVGRLAVSSKYLSPITRGGSGVSFFPALDYTQQYYLVVVLAFITGYLTYYIATSPFGLRLLAIREDELLASALGVKTTREKLLAMALHTVIAGIAGGILAFNIAYIDPKTVFAIKYTELPIVMVLFGSPGSVLGPILGAIAFIFVSEVLWASFPTLHQFLFGVAIMLVVIFLPGGIIEWLKQKGVLPRRRSI